MSGLLETPVLDAVRVALTYAPLGVADGARQELAELMGSPLILRLMQLQAENDELRAYAKASLHTMEAIISYEPEHLFSPKTLANTFLNHHAKTSEKVKQ